MVCLLAAPWVQLSVNAGNEWPHNALRHHWLMPISCHFRDCNALLVTILTHVSGAIASVQTFTFTFASDIQERWALCLLHEPCTMSIICQFEDRDDVSNDQNITTFVGRCGTKILFFPTNRYRHETSRYHGISNISNDGILSSMHHQRWLSLRNGPVGFHLVYAAASWLSK